MQTAADQQAAEILKLATEAKEQGQAFLELQLEVGTSQQRSNVSATGVYSHRESKSHAGLLSAVEQIGWHLGARDLRVHANSSEDAQGIPRR